MSTKVFNVGFFYDDCGTVLVEANDSQEAEAIVQNVLDHRGVDFEFKQVAREFGTNMCDGTKLTSAVLSAKDVQHDSD